MKNAGKQMNGLALHYYTIPSGVWRGSKGSATEFGENQYFSTLRNALRMEELVTKHSAIMDKYDPQKRVGLAVDEWGVWTDVEPGSNPGFLYQQNSLRDALVAGITLNLFNNHADRVKIANIAQMINVLQAMILTDKEKMLLTPTYHVFEMFTVHQDAKLLPAELQCADYENGGNKIPGLSVSASQDAAGKIHVTLCNLNPNVLAEVSCELAGAKAKTISGRVLTAEAVNAINTFDKPENVKPAVFTGFKIVDNGFTASLPAKSLVVLEVQ
jgi:alpha-N-arabinofuranosidase